jgi:hypothetical protein
MDISAFSYDCAGRLRVILPWALVITGAFVPCALWYDTEEASATGNFKVARLALLPVVVTVTSVHPAFTSATEFTMNVTLAVSAVCADAAENAANTSAESAAFFNQQHFPNLIPVRIRYLHCEF